MREYLLHDLDGAGALLLRSRTLRREITADRSWSELFEDFAEVTRCVRRAETIHLLRSALDFKTRSLDHQETRERYLEGRLFRFGPAEAVQSGVRTTTILFADIRGFTRASEGAVSEGDLARELYEIFDPAALIVQRFGGTIDKYLGDGFMATFTGGSRPGRRGARGGAHGDLAAAGPRADAAARAHHLPHRASACTPAGSRWPASCSTSSTRRRRSSGGR